MTNNSSNNNVQLHGLALPKPNTPVPLPNSDVAKGRQNVKALGHAASKAIIESRGLPSNIYTPPSKVQSIAASNTVLGAPSIIEMARSLKNDVDLIYEFCGENIEFIGGFGQHKGAYGALVDGLANPFDQADLMVQLLRQAGYTANYVFGQIRLTPAMWSNWLGTDPSTAIPASYFLSYSGIPNTIVQLNPTDFVIDMSHVWVQVNIGGTNYVFDPSFKNYTYTSGVDLTAATGFDGTTLMSQALSGATVTSDYVKDLNRANIRTKLGDYTTNLINWIKTNKSDASITDIVGGRTINPISFGLRQTSLPYQTPGDVPVIWTSIPNTYKAILTVNYDTISTSFYSADVYGKRLTLTFNPSTQAELKLDGTIVATSSVITLAWTTAFLTATHPFSSTWADQVGGHQIWTTKPYILANSWGQSGAKLSDIHSTNLRKAKLAGHGDLDEDVIGSSLTAMWFMWNAEITKITDILDQMCGMTTAVHHSFGVFGHFDTILENITGAGWKSTPLDGDWDREQYHRTALALYGVTLEAAVIAQMTRVGGVSTTPLIDIASTAGQKIYSATSTNWSTAVRPNLVNYDTPTLDGIETSYINQGWNVFIPENGALVKGTWNGYGYFSVPLPPFSGTIGIISGGLKGGSGDGIELPPDFTSDVLTGNFLLNALKDQYDRTQNLFKDYNGDPVNVRTGAFENFRTDLTVGSGNYPYMLSFSRHYNSLRRLENGPLGFGWRHNYQGSVNVGSNILAALGEDSVFAAAYSIAAFFAVKEILTDLTRPKDKYLTVAAIAQWWADRMVQNFVRVDTGTFTESFVRLPDGSYVCEAASNVGLVQNLDGTFTFMSAEKTAYAFNLAGQLVSITFPQGVVITYTYTSGRLTQVSNSSGRLLNVAYTGDKITSVNDGAGRTVSYSIDSQSNLLTFGNTAGESTTYEYDLPGRLTKLYLPANPTISIVNNLFDTLDRVKEQRDFSGNLTQYFVAGTRSEALTPTGTIRVWYYTPFGQSKRCINALGNKITKTFDGRSRIKRVEQPEGDAIEFSYDASNFLTLVKYKPKPGSGLSDLTNVLTWNTTWGRISSFTNALGRTTSWSYDPTTGNPITITRTQVGGQTPVSTASYNTRGQLQTITDESGQITKFNYNVADETLLSIVRDYGPSPHLNLTTSFSYTPGGIIASITSPRGFTTTYNYDSGNRLEQVTSALPFSQVQQYIYDPNGNLSQVKRSTGDIASPWQISQATYTPDCFLATYTGPDSLMAQTTNDADNRFKTYSDQASRITSKNYDAYGQETSMISPDSLAFHTKTYTPNGMVATVKDAKNNITTFQYNGFDLLSKRIYADGTFEQFTYDALGRCTLALLRTGQTISFTYDELGRVLTKSPSGQPTVTYAYDLVGRLLSTSTPTVIGDPSSGTSQLLYDSAGRFFKEIYPDGKSVTHTLDPDGRSVKLTYPDGYFVEKIYDSLGRLTDVKLNGATSSAVHIDYDGLSRRSRLTYENGVITDYVYEGDNALAQLRHTFSGESVVIDIVRDPLNRVAQLQMSDFSFEWLPAVQSTQAYGTASPVNAYPTVGSSSLTYNGAGSLTGDGVWSYTYNTEQKLLSATKAGVSVQFTYDHAFRNVQKAVGTTKTRYVYAGWQRIADYDAVADSLQNRYVYGTSPDEVLLRIGVAGAKTYYSHSNLQSVIAETDSTGIVSSKRGYSPFGESSLSTSSGHGFTGQRFDSETGLYYFKNRMYSPGLGRFLQTDPMLYVDGYNLYEYAGGDTINRKDPFGLTWQTNMEFLKLFLSGQGGTKKYDLSHIETREVINSPLGWWIALQGYWLSGDGHNSFDTALELSWNTYIALMTTAIPGIGVLAEASDPFLSPADQSQYESMAFSSLPGMLGNTAFQVGGVQRDGSIADKNQQEYIKIWRTGNTVHVKMQNVANADSFFLHMNAVPQSVVDGIQAVDPIIGGQLAWLKEQAANKDGQWQPIYQIFEWDLNLPPWNGACKVGG